MSNDPENSGSFCNYYLAHIKRPQNPEQAGVPFVVNCEDVIQALGMTFDEGCIFKSLWRTANARLGVKKADISPVREATKQVHYAQRILSLAEHVEQEKPDVRAAAWGKLSDEIKFVAKDGDGAVWGYADKPSMSYHRGCWLANGSSDAVKLDPRAISPLCAGWWTESMEQRP